MLSINMDDVIGVLQTIQTHLIAILAALVIAIIVIIAVRKLPKAVKRLIRGEACVAVVLVVLIMANLMCTGPLSTLLTSVAGKPVATIDEATTAEATELVKTITAEGVVLAENDEGVLPVTSGSKLNVFGYGSINPCYGGTGSGALNAAYPTVTLLDGLANAGIETNADLTAFYESYKADYQSRIEAYKDVNLPNVGMWAQDWTLPQPGAALYTDELMNQAKDFSDTAMIVIARVGGEGADLPTDMKAVAEGRWMEVNNSNETYYAGTYNEDVNEGDDWDEGDHYLQLTNQEEEMVQLVCENFDKVIVVYNGANAMELGWVNDYDSIKGVLLCPGTGQSGFDGFGRVVSGEVNPSGRTADTYVADLTAAPTWNNMGSHPYSNMEEYALTSAGFTGAESTNRPSFVNYVEGIYVGYKFYETAAAVGMEGFNYDEAVVYPFGYGLSYTTFSQEMSEITEADGSLNFSVTVTNTGDVAGKSVVEIYFNPPYTEGGIEKAAANLLDFGKTQTLEPGASETINFSIPVEQLASYDYQNARSYVLESGDYIISANADSHTVIDSKTYTVESTVTYNEDSKRDSDQTAAVNQFDYAAGDVEYLSRAGAFANYATATAAPASDEMSEEAKSTFVNIQNYVNDGTDRTQIDIDNAKNAKLTGEAVTTGQDSGKYKLVDLRGLDYNDPAWDTLLDSMTLDEFNALISLGGYQTNSVDSIEKYRTNDCDGPASINNNFTGQGSVGFPAAVLIAMTWNDEMANAFGDSIGTMADQMDTAGWYGPAMNIHRTAFAGRNFEYYSEDGVLSGSMAANAIIGAQAHGVYAYMKHFALNDQEANRCSMLCTWSNEQAIREIYLKPFEISVKEGNSLAVMSSFNYIGNRWAGGTYELCEVVLRDEWGFQGFVETDYFGVYNYMSADQAIRNGTDLMLVNYPTATNDVRFRSTNEDMQAMRQAAHRILYVTVNSRQYSELGIEQSTQPNQWETILTVVNVVVAVILVAWEVLLVRNYLKRKKTPEQA